MERVYHTWDKWECYPAGFYNSRAPNGMTKEEAEEVYREFLSDTGQFEFTLVRVVLDWKNSCEHYLTNENMNRIAWLGQACLAHKFGIPACYRGGYNRLTERQKEAADKMALKYLNNWLIGYGENAISADDCKSKTVANLY